MATDKKVLKFRIQKPSANRGRRRTKKGRKRNQEERFIIDVGGQIAHD
jgi:hypothetical protein